MNALREARPDIVAFSAYTGNYQWCLSWARRIKEACDVPVVFGGIHTTAVPEKVLENDCVDYVIRGEGEYAFYELLEHLDNKRPAEELKKNDNLGFKLDGQIIINPLRSYIQDLDALPFPDKELFFHAEPVLRYNPYLIMSSRGCPYGCSYCCNNLLHELYRGKGSFVRRRSVAHVMAELVEAQMKYRIRSVCFADDIFVMHPSWLEDFMSLYRARIGLPFYCNIHPMAFNEKIAHLLKDNGCCLVFLGVQSGSERVRKEVFLRNETNDHIIKAVACLKKMRIPFDVDNIFGAPGETEEDLKQSYELYRSIRPNMMQSFWLTYYPGTHIVALAQERGLLSQDDVENIKEGKIGFTHDTGCVEKSCIALYKKYELLFELMTVLPGRLVPLTEKLISFLPFKKFFSMLVFTFTGFIYFRDWILNKFRYAFFSYKDLKIK